MALCSLPFLCLFFAFLFLVSDCFLFVCLIFVVVVVVVVFILDDKTDMEYECVCEV